MTKLDQQFWDQRYQTHTTGWDLGSVSPPLKAYIDQLPDKNLRILIPGAGNAYEAAYLLEQGFTNITVIDIAPTVVEKLQRQFAGKPQLRVLLGDFFTHEGTYDLILEQTFFCALHPSQRPAYVRKMHALLAPGGRLAGVLFDKEFEKESPPFGGSRAEYEQLFSPFFELKTFAACYNSIPPRQGTELFMILQKREMS